MVPSAFEDQGFISSIGAAFFVFKCWNKIARLDTKLVNVLWDKKISKTLGLSFLLDRNLHINMSLPRV